MKKGKHIIYIISGILIFSAIFFMIIERFFHEQFISFLAVNFSSDGTISSAGSIKFYAYIYVRLLYVLAIIPALYYFNFKLLKRINPELAKNKLLIITYILCFILTILWFYMDQIGNMVFYYEGIAEIFSEILLLLTIIIFIRTLQLKPKPQSVYVAIVFLIIIVSFFFLEEISWGQTIFHWKTPQFIFHLNTQNETNFHNFFNACFRWLYPLLSLLLSIAFLYIYKIKEFIKDKEYKILLPSEQFTYFSFLFIVIGLLNLVYFPDANEILEEIIVLFLLSYAIELNKRTRAENF